jgi:hypothetical protein
MIYYQTRYCSQDAYVLMAILLSGKASKLLGISIKTSRKLLHIMIGNLPFLIPLFTLNSFPLNFPFFVQPIRSDNIPRVTILTHLNIKETTRRSNGTDRKGTSLRPRLLCSLIRFISSIFFTQTLHNRSRYPAHGLRRRLSSNNR